MTLDNTKLELAEEALSLIAKVGLKKDILAHAARVKGIDSAYTSLLFPNGNKDLLKYFSNMIDVKLEPKYGSINFVDMKVRERIFILVKLRIEEYTLYKVAIKKILQYYGNPLHIAWGLSQLWATSDKIWNVSQAHSTDFNYYTKRAILSIVYSSTLIYWLNDKSADNIKTWEFLDHRITDSLKLSKIKQNFAKIKKLPFLRLV
jgi:ubiquinone biosynthesis protein COQ9